MKGLSGASPDSERRPTECDNVHQAGLTSLIRYHAKALREGKNAFAGITRTEAGIAFVGLSGRCRLNAAAAED
jgi:hypothetical protein